jgi:hypothetical protein
MLLGIAVGYACHELWPDPQTAKTIAGYISLFTDIFLRLIKMIIAPLVFTTLVVGVAHMGDTKSVGRIGGKAMIWFVSASLTVRRLPVRLPALPSVARHWGCLSRGGQQSGQGVAADVHMGVLARIWLCGKEPGARCGEVAQRQSRRHPGMDRRGCGALLSGRRGRASHAPNVGFV